MSTILGHHISVVRPFLPRRPLVYKHDYLKHSYNREPKTLHKGKVASVCIKTLSGKVECLSAPTTHAQVSETFNIQSWEVATTGWRLVDGTFLWR